MQNQLKISFLLILLSVAFLILAVFSHPRINAAGDDPICVPDCGASLEYVPDFQCINRKLLDPEEDCCENRCANAIPGDPSSQDPAAFQELVNVFGTTIAIETNEPFGVIAVIVNVLITTVLGFISLYTLVKGIYVGGIKRANTVEAGEIEEISQTIRTMFLGFILAWSFIFIIQFITGIIGLGSLNDLVVLEDDPGADSENQLIIR